MICKGEEMAVGGSGKACIDDAKKLCGNENQTSGATIACLR